MREAGEWRYVSCYHTLIQIPKVFGTRRLKGWLVDMDTARGMEMQCIV